jgi:sialic acid synthase SpsE
MTTIKRANSSIKIQNVIINRDSKTYFIADIAANHDGSLQRAIDLIHLAAEAGASAAKFQHFQANSIVSDSGFKSLGSQLSHQSTWGKSVYEVYQDASLNLDWTESLKEACKHANIHFLTTPYNLEVVDYIDLFIPAYKIGSGDITWLDLIKKVASKNKPYMLATGASSMDEVSLAVSTCLDINQNLILMQCNTNYTGSLENFRYINLNVLKSYSCIYPEMILGLSDHTPGHSCVLGAVALGAKVIEKHFTDDTNLAGPDHLFSMDRDNWKEMVDRVSELEFALGRGEKKIEKNEIETAILQRRSLRAVVDINIGTVITPGLFIPLRPCPNDAFKLNKLSEVMGKKVERAIKAGDYLRKNDVKY